MTVYASIQLLTILGQLHTPRMRMINVLESYLEPNEKFEFQALTQRSLRRWELLSEYWQKNSAKIINRSLGKNLISESLANKIKEITPQINVKTQKIKYSARLDARVWACFITQNTNILPMGVAYPIEIRRVISEARIPPFHLSARFREADMVAAANLAIEAAGIILGRELRLNQQYPLAVDAAFPDDMQLTDESASLAFALATIKQLCDIEKPGWAASGIVLRDSGKLQVVQGFDLPYGKLEACFDQGVQYLILPQNTALHAFPAAGICIEKESDSHYRYFLADDPTDDMQIYLLNSLSEALDILWGKHKQSHLQGLKKRLSTGNTYNLNRWDQALITIESHYPDWLAIGFKIYFEFYSELCQFPSQQIDDWKEILKQQMHWIAGFLRYVLSIFVSGIFTAQQQIDDLIFAIQPNSTLAEIWEGLKNIANYPKPQALPFQQVYIWLNRCISEWGILIHQLERFEYEQHIERLQQGLYFNMLRLMKLLEKAQFMKQYSLFGLLPGQEHRNTIVCYSGMAMRQYSSQTYALPMGTLMIEDKTTRSIFPLPVYRLCSDCLKKESYYPLVWSGLNSAQRPVFVGCEHGPLEFHSDVLNLNSESSIDLEKGLNAARQTQPVESKSDTLLLDFSEDKINQVKTLSILSFELCLDKIPYQELKNVENHFKIACKQILENLNISQQKRIKQTSHEILLITSGNPEKLFHFALLLYTHLHEDLSCKIPKKCLMTQGLAMGKLSQLRDGSLMRSHKEIMHLVCPDQFLLDDACCFHLAHLAIAYRPLFHPLGRVGQKDFYCFMMVPFV